MKFTEQQKHKSKWLWGILLASVLFTYFFLLRASYYQLYLGQPYGDKPMGDYALMITIVLMTLLFGGVFWLLRSAQLVCTIDQDVITYHLQPYQFKPTVISWSDVSSWEITEYNAISQYGGWGVRMTSSGMAYIIDGNKGLKLLLRNGKSILIGTQKEAELRAFLSEIGKGTEKR